VNDVKKYAVIVAGGSGTRMKTDRLKQFIPQAGKPLLMHTIGCFTRFDATVEIILVLPGNQHEHWQNLCETYFFSTPHTLVAGGETRFHSVRNGLAVIPGEGIVFIHDGVRPLVSSDTLARCLEGTLKNGNAIPSLPIAESVREISGHRNYPVDREKLVLIQTPQTFRVSQIKAAYSAAYEKGFTDDASVLDRSGTPVFLSEGNRENIKITWPEDLLVAETLFRHFHF